MVQSEDAMGAPLSGWILVLAHSAVTHWPVGEVNLSNLYSLMTTPTVPYHDAAVLATSSSKADRSQSEVATSVW